MKFYEFQTVAGRKTRPVAAGHENRQVLQPRRLPGATNVDRFSLGIDVVQKNRGGIFLKLNQFRGSVLR
jgi:hypothetical protein